MAAPPPTNYLRELDQVAVLQCVPPRREDNELLVLHVREVLPGVVGRCGSWVAGRGSWVVGRGSWVVDRGSVDRGSWVVGRGSCARARVLAGGDLPG